MATTADKVLEKLAAFDLQQDGSGQYRSNSPLRPGSNSHGFTLKIDDPEHGAYDDKAGGQSGSLYELATALGIPLPERGAATVTKRSYRDLAEYATAHGATAELFRAAGWSDVATHQGRPALAFVTASGTRYRFIDGDKPYYKSDMGYHACWYGLRRALAVAAESFGPLVICNGEASTIVAQAAGIAAISVTGGEKAMAPALLDELLKAWPSGLIQIALDCDSTGRAAAAAIQKQITAKGRDAETLDLRLTDGGDLADFCMLHGKDAAARLLEPQAAAIIEVLPHDTTPLVQALEMLSGVMRQDAKLRRQEDVNRLCAEAQAQIDRIQMAYAAPTLLDFADLGAANLTDLEKLMKNPDPIQGLRSRIPSLDKALGGFQPEVYVIYGATSMGKSWLAVSLARAFIDQGPGLVVTTESSPRRWLIRLAASLTGIDAEKIETGQVDAEQYDLLKRTYAKLGRLGCRALSNGQPTPAQVRAAALAGDYQWVIVDSASKMTAPGTQSIYDRTVAVSDGLQNLMTEKNIPVIVTSQVGRDVAERANKHPQLEDAYGGGAIEHNAGVVLGLYRHQYYVDKGTATASADYPPNMTLVRVLKNRWRNITDVNAVKLMFAGSRGFFEMAREG